MRPGPVLAVALLIASTGQHVIAPAAAHSDRRVISVRNVTLYAPLGGGQTAEIEEFTGSATAFRGRVIEVSSGRPVQGARVTVFWGVPRENRPCHAAAFTTGSDGAFSSRSRPGLARTVELACNNPLRRPRYEGYFSYPLGSRLGMSGFPEIGD